MSSRVLDNLIEQLDSLTVDKQLRLAAYLVERARGAYLSSTPPRRWSDIRGLASPSLLGQDAQVWVSRTRHEADKHRETSKRNQP